MRMRQKSVKADALFSYQPPFNILAFVVLKPLSWVLSPRALHSVNVFLIKLTNFPILVVIGFYERYLTSGQLLHKSGKEAALNFFNSLPRHIKHTPLVEALVGSSSSDLYEAIFDVEAEHEVELSEMSDDEVPRLRSVNSREPIHRRISPSPSGRQRPSSLVTPSRRENPSPLGSPRPYVSTNLDPPPSSPLAKLFTRGSSKEVTADTAQLKESVKRMEELVGDMKDPVRGLRDEIKELQDRQSRIESLLLTLTRGMRNERFPTNI
ncbi:receptor-activated ca2+-permeable cation channel [Moniliophthora roreri]|nr:receptor-activated ca2+-permeable cation channel [Moniliophthora roreri]